MFRVPTSIDTSTSRKGASWFNPCLVACLHSAQTAERGDRWRKICKANYIWLFVPGDVLWGSQERRVRCQGFDFCWSKELVQLQRPLLDSSSPTHSIPGQDLQSDISVVVTASSAAPCSPAGCGLQKIKACLCEALVTQREQGLSLTQSWKPQNHRPDRS